MKCLYCGGPLTLALLKKITGAGEFCSDECRRGYQSEFNRLAVGRLQQARANRRVIPTSAGPVLPAAAASPAHFGEMKPISEAPPAPLWTQSPLPPPAAKPMSGLVMVCEEVVPVPSVLPDPQVPAAPELTSLFEAVRAERAVEIVEPECAAGSSKLALSDAKSDCEEEVWMAPRGLFPLSVRAQAIAADLKIPVLSPAPIFVYLQLPESLVSTSIGRPRLFAAGTAEMKLGKQSGEHPLRVGVLEPMSQGLRNALQAGSRVAERVFTSPAGFSSDQCYGLSFSWPAAAEPVAFSNLQFRPPAPSVGRALVAELPCQDPRFDVYLQSDGRMELRQRLRELSERRAAQRAQGDAGPTVTLPLKTVEPALNLLAAFGTAMLERQSRLGDSPPAMSFPEPAMSLSAEELLPKLVAGLTAMPLAEQRSAYPAPGAPVPGGPATGGDGFPALPQAPGASTSHQPSPHQGAPYQGAPHQSTPHQTALHPGPAGPSGAGEAGYPATPHIPAAPYPPPPAPIADGRPAGWPADVPYPPEGALALPPAAAPLAQQPAPMAQAPVAPPLPGMPAISGNVYMFGTEINSGGEQKQDEDDGASTALAPVPKGNLEKAAPSEAETTSGDDQPNFTRPNGFPLSGGGMMNVGTMVVVNQPSGTVNINANSATASTFESRLRQKERTPLSSIAPPAGLQIPAPESPKDLPLRMNFQGRLETALPVQWPELEATAMRKKMFFGGPLKPRRAGGFDALASAPRPAPAAPAAAPASGLTPAADAEKPGAMNWIKSISGRFGKK